jgi:hypothetical protein
MMSIQSLLEHAPEQVRLFCVAMYENAKECDRYARKDYERSIDIADSRVCLEHTDDDCWTICDNYERAPFIYVVHPDGSWKIHEMYGDEPEKDYTFEQAMADAAIMFTG